MQSVKRVLVPFRSEDRVQPYLDALRSVGLEPVAHDVDAPATMDGVAERLDQLAVRLDRPLMVAEIGVRSAVGSAAKPWESAEERDAAADPELQADVLADWMAALDRPRVRNVLVWRWLTDPVAGGPRDTDFTVQGKAAERVLRCAWIADCSRK